MMICLLSPVYSCGEEYPPLTRERILPSATFVVLCNLSGLLIHFYFLRMLIFSLLKFLPSRWLIYFGFFQLMIASLTCTGISLDFFLIAPVSQQPNTNSEPEISCRSLTSFICLEVKRESTTLSHETALQSVVQTLMNFWKWRYSV